MVSADTLSFGVGILGNVISLFMFLSPVPTFIKTCKKGSVEQYSPIPYLATFMNCVLWVLYAMPFVKPNSILVLTTNTAGIFIEIVYLSLFALHANDIRTTLKVVALAVGEAVLVVVLVALVLSLAHTAHLRTQVVGMVAIVINIVMYAAPLSVIKLVWTTKSVEYMPFFLSLASFASGIAWAVYAIRPFDPYIAAPNGLGTLFGLAQLIFYATYYKSTNEQTGMEKVMKSRWAWRELVWARSPLRSRFHLGPYAHIEPVNNEAEYVAVFALSDYKDTIF